MDRGSGVGTMEPMRRSRLAIAALLTVLPACGGGGYGDGGGC